MNELRMVITQTKNGNEIKLEFRYFITSLTDLSEFAGTVRKHWVIEIICIRALIFFREDASRAKKDNSHLKALRKILCKSSFDQAKSYSA